jgi:predicted ATPase
MIRRVAESTGFDRRPVRAFRRDPGRPAETSRWPATVPAVAQMLRDGLELPAGLTVLVGENGSGKSTLVEILAEAYGLNPQGGSALGRFRTRRSEPGLGSAFIVERGVDPAVVATHSPVVAAVPGASLLELGEWGFRAARWDELDIVGHWREFLREPDSYFRHLFED